MTKNKSSTNGTQIIESAALLKLQQQKREELQKRMSESADDKCNLSRMSDSQGSPFKVDWNLDLIYHIFDILFTSYLHDVLIWTLTLFS